MASGESFIRQPVPWVRRVVLLVTIAVALVVAVVWLPPRLVCGGISSGVRQVDGQCVGVTDGSFVFDPRFHEIEKKIKKENDRVARVAKDRGIPLVKVALLTTLTPKRDSPLDHNRIRSSLQGAYVALYRANTTKSFQDDVPLIQLYLANEGSHQAQWETAVADIEAMTDDDVPLVAVFGQGVSSTRTRAAARRLSDSGIPMVSGVVTADGLDFAHIPGLLRASPSNTDYVTALRRHLDKHKELRTAIMVHDRTEPDLYVTTLRRDYEKLLKPRLKFLPNQPFVGTTFGQNAVSVFNPIVGNICAVTPDVVLYAGRALDLASFLEALSGRICRDKPLTVLFAVTGVSVHTDKDVMRHLEEGNLTLTLASAVHPGWATGEVEPPRFFDSFYTAFQDRVGGGPQALENGYAIMYHDALATAVCAIRLNNSQVVTAPPEPEDVRNNLLLLNARNVVKGASGTLSFTENRGGNPGGKYIPIVTYPGAGDADDGKPYITPAQ